MRNTPERSSSASETTLPATLFRQLKALLVVIVTEPGSKAARQRGYQGGLWRVDVPGQDWMILWELIDDEVVVGYIGPGL